MILTISGKDKTFSLENRKVIYRMEQQHICFDKKKAHRSNSANIWETWLGLTYFVAYNKFNAFFLNNFRLSNFCVAHEFRSLAKFFHSKVIYFSFYICSQFYFCFIQLLTLKQKQRAQYCVSVICRPRLLALFSYMLLAIQNKKVTFSKKCGFRPICCMMRWDKR